MRDALKYNRNLRVSGKSSEHVGCCTDVYNETVYSAAEVTVRNSCSQRH